VLCSTFGLWSQVFHGSVGIRKALRRCQPGRVGDHRRSSLRYYYNAGVCVYYLPYCSTYYKAVRVWGGGGQGRTCAGTREEPGTLTQGGALFSLVPLSPLVWESNPKLQGGWWKTQPPASAGPVDGTLKLFFSFHHTPTRPRLSGWLRTSGPMS
jgi:hypothetical protein